MFKPPLILLVDDETHVINVLSVKLRSAGFHVASASDGCEAIRCALEETPDLIITDYRMPGMDGRELCDALLHYKKTCNTPVIMLSGRSHGMNNNDTQGVQNIKVIIGKPFSPREVLNKVYEILELQPGERIARAS